jgi:hypothetical protein
VDCDTIQVSWDHSTSSGIEFYNVFRDSVWFRQVGASSRSTTDNDRSEETTHSYAVEAYNGVNHSRRSSSASATTPACGGQSPIAQLVGSIQLNGWIIAFDETLGVASVVSRDRGLSVIDLGDPAQPSVVGTLNLENTERAVAMEGGFAYVLESAPDPIDRASLAIVDLTTPSRPSLVARLDLPGNFVATGIAVDGTLAYVAATDAGLQIVDISAPQAPRIIGSAPTSGPATQVAVENGFALLVTPNQWVIVDARDPRNPSVSHKGAASKGISARTIADERLYEVWSTDLNIRDFSAPPSLPSLGFTKVEGGADIAVVNNYAIVATRSGAAIIDVLDSTNPEIVQTLATPGSLLRVIGGGGLALAIDEFRVLHVISVQP